MTTTRVLEPRHEKVAARASTVLFLVSAVLLATYLILDPAPAAPDVRVAAWAEFGVLLVLGLASRVVPATWLTRLGLWPVLSATGVLAVANFMLMFPDQSLMAHALFAFPVLFSASQMRAPVAVGITTFAVVVDAVTLVRIEPLAMALLHWLYVAPVLIVIGVLLVQAMNLQDRLITALHDQAAMDPLTGLVTRRVLDETLQRALSAAPSAGGTALILVDVDAFKSINDAHGHPVGDDALVHLASVLTAQVRTGDAVVSRLGGDELAVLLPGCSSQTATRRAEQLVDAVRAAPMLLPDGTLLALSVSVGVAHAPQHATQLRALYAAADAALYEAKKAGRDRVAVAPA